MKSRDFKHFRGRASRDDMLTGRRFASHSDTEWDTSRNKEQRPVNPRLEFSVRHPFPTDRLTPRRAHAHFTTHIRRYRQCRGLRHRAGGRVTACRRRACGACGPGRGWTRQSGPGLVLQRSHRDPSTLTVQVTIPSGVTPMSATGRYSSQPVDSVEHSSDQRFPW
jgi:hypothetical protein